MDEKETPTSWCPSGDAHAPESVVLGVRSGQDGRVVYLADPVPASQVLGDVPEGVEPRRILRFASHCVSGCANRRGNDCTLIERVLAAPPAAESNVPRCHLRARCQWWAQSGVEGCRRCPAVSTRHLADDELSGLIADPSTTREQLDAWIAAEAG
ncbi:MULTISPECIES: hypothetical protein [unclassified Streptomyces]|uniref:hypothetical protein n=1 Tax=unclassified Streptomyces TaxID=2593676 RepID=UPI000DABC85A|nr:MULTISPECIES: hypothetical protein [unclassified Streptomyces]PZT77570.1 hypothetical protein DNK56_30835 [Streptomyces sp. AC1-42W]PZT78476.1 hypothetical protein DNK55_01850 [Streptomyces sp. AC1-42T]